MLLYRRYTEYRQHAENPCKTLHESSAYAGKQGQVISAYEGVCTEAEIQRESSESIRQNLHRQRSQSAGGS